MKKATLYIAASLDGFIACADGSVEWLPAPAAGGEDYGYAAFLEGVDTLVMGRKTYEQVRTPWPYGDRRCVVFSGRRGGQRDGRAEWAEGDIAAWVRELKEGEGEGGIWLVGGAEVIAACLAGEVVDEIILTIVPVLLGEGIRLFPETTWMTRLRMESVRSYADGLVQLRYGAVPAKVETPALAFA